MKAALTIVLVFALQGAATPAESPAQRGAPERHHPGPLETFLKEAKAPDLESEAFGSLEGADKARVVFKSIIAWDPAKPDTKLKGLAIEVVKGPCRHTTYVDVDLTAPQEEDWLKELLDELQYIKDKQEVLEHWSGKSSGSRGTTVSVLNGLRPTARALGVAETVLNIGWYVEGEGKDAAVSINGSPCGDLHFPNTTITEVIGVISAARDYLRSH
jgi:hypothetical protein